MTLCFAFGSNLAPSQMLQRCPGCRIVSQAVLPDYRLAFGGRSARWGGPVATVVPALGRHVPGLIYWLSDADLEALDRFEGHPFVYKRFTARVIATGERELLVQVYQMKATKGAQPAEAYAKVLRAAYAAWGFDRRLLPKAARLVIRTPARGSGVARREA